MTECQHYGLARKQLCAVVMSVIPINKAEDRWRATLHMWMCVAGRTKCPQMGHVETIINAVAKAETEPSSIETQKMI